MPLRIRHGCARKAAGVKQRLFDCNCIFVVRAELRDDRCYLLLDVQQALFDEQPDAGAHDCLGQRMNGEHGVVGGRLPYTALNRDTERAQPDEPSMPRHRNLRTRQRATINVQAYTLVQRLETRAVEANRFRRVFLDRFYRHRATPEAGRRAPGHGTVGESKHPSDQSVKTYQKTLTLGSRTRS